MKTPFDITGRYALELKEVLRAGGFYEGIDFTDMGFNPEQHAAGKRELDFKELLRAIDAQNAWDDHIRRR